MISVRNIALMRLIVTPMWNTVLALALADSLPDFRSCLKKIRYKNGESGYLTATILLP